MPRDLEAYGGAVRADERRRALDHVDQAIEGLFEADLEGQAREWRDRCLAVVERMRSNPCGG